MVQFFLFDQIRISSNKKVTKNAQDEGKKISVNFAI